MPRDRPSGRLVTLNWGGSLLLIPSSTLLNSKGFTILVDSLEKDMKLNCVLKCSTKIVHLSRTSLILRL